MYIFVAEPVGLLGMARTAKEGDKEMRGSVDPRRFTPIGGYFWVGDARYVVVPRREGLKPYEACRGCHFSTGYCPSQQCSPFDREDGKGVWFVRVE
jgi:hypothetical protein